MESTEVKKDTRTLLDRAFEEANVQAALMHLLEKRNSTDVTGLGRVVFGTMWQR